MIFGSGPHASRPSVVFQLVARIQQGCNGICFCWLDMVCCTRSPLRINCQKPAIVPVTHYQNSSVLVFGLIWIHHGDDATHAERGAPKKVPAEQNTRLDDHTSHAHVTGESTPHDIQATMLAMQPLMLCVYKMQTHTSATDEDA